MSSVSLRNDTLIEISTFLVRRWSENDQITVEFSTKKTNETRKKENRVILNRNKVHVNALTETYLTQVSSKYCLKS